MTGNCGSISHLNTLFVCNDPPSSVLFDGNTPTLSALNGDAWASQLLVLHTTRIVLNIGITFDFTSTQNYDGLDRIELIGINCLSKSTLESVQLSGSGEHTSGFPITGFIVTSEHSCNSLVSVCITNIPLISASLTTITIEFTSSDWVYIGEITFYSRTESAGTCHPEIFGPTTTPTPHHTTDTPTTPPDSTTNATTSAGTLLKMGRVSACM